MHELRAPTRAPACLGRYAGFGGAVLHYSHVIDSEVGEPEQGEGRATAAVGGVAKLVEERLLLTKQPLGRKLRIRSAPR